MANVIQAKTTRPDLVLENFIKKLNAFIAQTNANLKKMKQKHQQMAAHWQGDQYNHFTAVLNETIKDATKELVELTKLKTQLDKKLVEMREAMNHK